MNDPQFSPQAGDYSGQMPVADQATQTVQSTSVDTSTQSIQITDQGIQPISQPVGGGPSRKEQPPMTVEYSGEMPSGMQSVEQLRTPEIPVEVESYIEEVKSEPSHLPEEVILAGDQVQVSSQAVLPQTKIILPLTQQQYLQGKKADPNTSFRWLAEWTEKIKAMFPDIAVWREN